MIVVSGEALMDVFAVADTASGVQLDARIGGSPFNVALGLARLAQPVAFFGGVSTGFLGDRLLRALQQEGISTVCTQRLAAPATLSLVGLDAQGVPSYTFMGEGAADRLLPLAALLAALAERGLLSRPGLATVGGGALAAVLAFAAQAAALTCSRRGADLPLRKELPLC